jgi:multidrug efflux pump subunit AcrA (membrane-fusion protein)
VFQGIVTRTAGAINPASRTMLTEVQVPNPEGLLLSGSYATVRFRLERSEPPFLIPSSALLIDADGVRVGVVDGDGTLRYRSIQIGRDYGNEVEVLTGVDATDVLATALSPNVADGSRVRIAQPTSAASR